jgi:hypothetical protein
MNAACTFTTFHLVLVSHKRFCGPFFLFLFFYRVSRLCKQAFVLNTHKGPTI